MHPLFLYINQEEGKRAVVAINFFGIVIYSTVSEKDGRDIIDDIYTGTFDAALRAYFYCNPA